MRVEEFFTRIGVEQHKQKRYFSLARKAQKKSTMRDAMGVCLLPRKGDPIEGYNIVKNHPLMLRFNFNFYSRHAEIQALVKAKGMRINVVGGTIFVYRQNRLGQIGMAKPCRSCFDALKMSGIRNVFYTTTNGYEYYSM